MRQTLRMFAKTPLAAAPDVDEGEHTLFLAPEALIRRGERKAATEQDTIVSEPSLGHTEWFDVEAAPADSTQALSAETTQALREESSEIYRSPRLPLAQRIRQSIALASPARKATLVVLPLMLLLVSLKPIFKPRPSPAKRAIAAAAIAPSARNTEPPAPAAALVPARAPLEPSPASAAAAAGLNGVAVKPGVSLERAATDSLASGDYARALELYRALAAARPEAPAYSSAVKVLERQRGMSRP
jgi:hypothetical protein